jgi:hypothetical protein
MASSRLKPPHDALASRISARLSVGAAMGELLGAAVLEAEKNLAIPGQSGARLKELWIEWSSPKMDLRIGRQIIIWGQADGIQITDLLCPPDYTESVTRSLEDVRIPVEAALLRIRAGPDLDVEAVFIPFFKSAVLPEPSNPWSAGYGAAGPALKGARRPPRSLEHSEMALRISAHLPGLDLAASFFRTTDDFPVAGPGEGGGVEARFLRQAVLGLSAAKSMGSVVWRAEAAFRPDQGIQAARPEIDGPKRAKTLKWLAGLDFAPGGGWSLSGQLAGEALISAPKGAAPYQGSLMATFRVERKFMEQTLSVSNSLYADLESRSLYDAAAIEYQLRDGLLLALGADLFLGREGRFGALRGNSQAWTRLRWHF